eukprot:m.99269 g.99269  ORF g.99269 m.99269 type:complete len:280 (-) comp12454_c0_seq3:27-866(-)
MEPDLNSNDPLKVLGLPWSSEDQQITMAAKKLQFKHHPDKGGDTVAYVRIRDAAKRAKKGIRTMTDERELSWVENALRSLSPSRSDPEELDASDDLGPCIGVQHPFDHSRHVMIAEQAFSTPQQAPQSLEKAAPSEPSETSPPKRKRKVGPPSNDREALSVLSKVAKHQFLEVDEGNVYSYRADEGTDPRELNGNGGGDSSGGQLAIADASCHGFNSGEDAGSNGVDSHSGATDDLQDARLWGAHQTVEMRHVLLMKAGAKYTLPSCPIASARTRPVWP